MSTIFIKTKMEHSKSEIAVQDYVAGLYEDKRYNIWYSKDYQLWWSKKMVALLPTNAKWNCILDDGCGTGNFIEAIPPEKRDNVIGCDLSPQMIVRAKKRIKTAFIQDAQKLSFVDAKFDIVFARSLLHHLPNPSSGVKEIARVLKPGGCAVFADTLDTLASRIPRHLTENSEHFSEEHKSFGQKQYLRLLRKHLIVEKVVFFGYLAYPLLGFADIFDMFKYVPFKKIIANLLYSLDWMLERIPVLNKHFSWGIMVLTKKARVDMNEN